MVNQYLVSLASQLIITSNERSIIDNHIDVLADKVSYYFGNSEIKSKFAFGSYTRKTLMPRKADTHSDVDYMIVFNNPNLSPRTYLDKLRGFAGAKYPSSDIYPSFPTVVLELSKIIIELVPAIENIYGYQIPSSENNYNSWIYTYPNSFNANVTNKNKNNNKMIRPLIRLMKYWNAKNEYVFSSY